MKNDIRSYAQRARELEAPMPRVRPASWQQRAVSSMLLMAGTTVAALYIGVPLAASLSPLLQSANNEGLVSAAAIVDVSLFVTLILHKTSRTHKRG